MSNTIKLKRGSGSDPSASDLEVGELAIRTDSGKIFTKKDNGSVAEISGGGGGGIDDGDKGDITISNGGDTFTIDSGVIDNANIASNAAISGTKINPDFGSQNIYTDGHVDLPDSSKIKLGNGDDLEIYHNNNDSFIDNYTGNLYFRGDGGQMHFRPNNSEEALVLKPDGAVEIYNDGTKRFESSSFGATVKGDLFLEDVSPELRFVDSDGSQNYQIRLNADILKFTDITNSVERMQINSDGHVDIFGNLDVGAGIDVTGDITGTGNLTLTSTNGGSQVSPILELYRNSGSPADDDYLGKIDFTGRSTDNSSKESYAFITAQIDDASGFTEDGIINFVVKKAGTVTNVAKLTSTNLQLTNGTGLDVTGNISCSGTVDGRDVATDGTKLDGIESNATADQTASEILTLLKTVDGAGSGLNADTLDGINGANFLRSDTSDTMNGDLTLSGFSPDLNFVSTTNNPDWKITNYEGTLVFFDITNNANKFLMRTNEFQSNVVIDAQAGVDVTGNITVSGLVDGVDIATRDTLFGGLTSSSGVLTDGVTATTQSAGDNTTKVATTAFVSTAVSNIIDSAPSALNTLNELAAALGDDANFSTTITNSIGTKMPLAGGQFTGNITFSGTQTVDGRDLSVDGAKLDGIESGATADQSNSEIKTAYEANSNTNAFTDALLSKLNGIAASATNVTNNNQLTNGAGYITATLTQEQVEDFVGGMLTGNTESGITVTYQDSDGTIDFSVASQTDNNFTNALLSKLNGIAAGATNVTNTNQLTNGAGFITSADGGNAATLDGIDSSSFLRSDADDVATRRIRFENNVTDDEDNMATSTDNLGCIEIKNTGSGNDAFMAFHSGNDFAFYFGLDADSNKLAVGGWSMGANKYAIYHEGNNPSYNDLLNKPTIPTNNNQLTNGAGYSTFSGSYNDLSNKPTIPTNNNQLTNGAGYITSVSGQNYNLLSNKPTIPTNNNQLTNGAGYVTTNTTYSAFSGYGLFLSGTQFGLANDRRRNANEDVQTGNNSDQIFFDTDVGIRFYTNGAEDMRLTDGGVLHVDDDVVAYSTTISDIRLKKDIELINNPLEIIDAINGYTFTFKKDNKKSAGVVAQEVEKVFPQAVKDQELPYVSEDIENPDVFKTVEYDQIVGLLVQAVKELSGKIKKLEGK